MKDKMIILCLGLMLVAQGGFARVEGNLVPYEARLSKQQDLIVGDVVSLEFFCEIQKDNWFLVSSLPYPQFKSIRPVFAQGEAVGLVWEEGDLTRSLTPVRESEDLAAPLILDRHELVWAKKFKINARNLKVSGTLKGEFREGFGDSLEVLTYELPVSMELEARDSAVKRWLMKSEKINDVLAVVVTIFLGLIVYIFLTQRKLKKLTELANEIKKGD